MVSRGRQYERSDDKRLGCGLQAAFEDPDVLTAVLTPLKHLKIEAPWKLDYACIKSGCRPFLCLNNGDSLKPLSCTLDGSPESAWERVILDWFAARCEESSDRIITDFGRFAEEADGIHSGQEVLDRLSPSQKEQLAKQDLTPSVTVNGDIATVRYAEFGPWHGLVICERDVNLKTGEITESKTANARSKVIFRYDCGVRY